MLLKHLFLHITTNFTNNNPLIITSKNNHQ